MKDNDSSNYNPTAALQVQGVQLRSRCLPYLEMTLLLFWPHYKKKEKKSRNVSMYFESQTVRITDISIIGMVNAENALVPTMKVKSGRLWLR